MATSRQRCECHAGLATAYKYIYLSIFTLHFGTTPEPAPLPSPEGWTGRRSGLSRLGAPDTAHGLFPSDAPATGAPSSPQPVSPCPGLGRGEGNFVGNKLHCMDFALSCLLLREASLGAQHAHCLLGPSWAHSFVSEAERPRQGGEPVLTLPLSPNPWGTGHLGLRKAGWECGFEPFPVFFSRGSNGHGSRSLDSRGHTAGSEPSRTQ